MEHNLTQENFRELITSKNYTEIIKCFGGLIGKYVGQVSKYIRNATIDRDDLESCAQMAIIQAVDAFVFDPKQSDEGNRRMFLRLVELRIKTAVLDEKNRFISQIKLPRRLSAKLDKAYAIVQEAQDASVATLRRVIQAQCDVSFEEAAQLYRIACMVFLDCEKEVNDLFEGDAGTIMDIPVNDPFADELIFHNLKSALLSRGQTNLIDRLTIDNDSLVDCADEMGLPIDYLRGKCISAYLAIQEGRHGTIHSKR